MRKVKLGIIGAGSFVQRRVLPILAHVESIQLTCFYRRETHGRTTLRAKKERRLEKSILREIESYMSAFEKGN